MERRTEFEWELSKAATNRRKHGVSFDEAIGVFAGALILDDLSHSEAEPRFVAIGISAKHRWLTVVFTRPGNRLYRIVSARKSTAREREYYAQAKNEAGGA
jgi:uncharacterized DUF497 family protein